MSTSLTRPALALPLLVIALLSACGGGTGESSPSDATTAASSLNEPELRAAALAVRPPQPPVDTSAFVDVGEKLFKDPNLSTSGQMACVSCHVENAGHADKAGTQLPLGGPTLATAGMRSSPTARYLNENGAFRIDAKGQAWGGFTWDGRADSRQEQAGEPFFEAVEMALPGSVENPAALTDRVRASDYYPALQALYSPSDIDTDQKLFRKITELIDIYQRDDADYNLFDSRFDQHLQRKVALSPAEARGLKLFSDPARGNCASCHTAASPKPLFTDFGYAAIAPPRNHAGPKNADPAYFDLGLCMRERALKAEKKRATQYERYCGKFKTPTLRNVDRTAPYFHNGSVATLEEAVRFHFERDSQSAKWYRRADGSADVPYNDLPVRYQANIARGKPFNGSYSPTDAEIADLLAFLKTLNDGDQLDTAH